MAKPIPVFAFVFAAYAAATRGSASQTQGEPGPKGPAHKYFESELQRVRVAFARAWTCRPDADGYFVKVALVGAADEAWLTTISKTTLGFCGVDVFSGRTVLFDEANIVDWRQRGGVETTPTQRPIATLYAAVAPDVGIVEDETIASAKA